MVGMASNCRLEKGAARVCLRQDIETRNGRDLEWVR